MFLDISKPQFSKKFDVINILSMKSKMILTLLNNNR